MILNLQIDGLDFICQNIYKVDVKVVTHAVLVQTLQNFWRIGVGLKIKKSERYPF